MEPLHGSLVAFSYMIPLIGMFKCCGEDLVVCFWPWGLGEIGYVICLLCFIVGCGIVFFGQPHGFVDEEQVLKFLPAMNGLSEAGSACQRPSPGCATPRVQESRLLRWTGGLNSPLPFHLLLPVVLEATGIIPNILPLAWFFGLWDQSFCLCKPCMIS